MSVQSMINTGTHQLLSGTPEMLLKQAVKLMVAKQQNAMVALNSESELAGILTDHDVMRALAHNDGQLGEENISRWMSEKVITCESDCKLSHAIYLMGRHKIRHLVAMENGRPVAVIGIRALLAKIHENDEMEINVLRDMAVARIA
uniref:CBS domain-containing protein n=1 Tax=Pararhizobium sp. IMCC3301 TaxID=3067904 RepID=UPI00274075E3|nr:CBS domain-containing protein [Pararhizobium sp. IMCC3301]